MKTHANQKWNCNTRHNNTMQGYSWKSARKLKSQGSTGSPINTAVWIAVKHGKPHIQLHSCKLTNLVTSVYSQQLNL